MRQFYYTILTLMRGRGSNLVKLLSLALGLTIGVLLFSQIAYELNYERCYPDADRLALVRGGWENRKTEKIEGYDQTLYAPLPAALRTDLPDYIEDATLTFNLFTVNVFREGKKLNDVRYAYVDSHFFATLGIEVLQGDPKELETPHNIFVSESFARRAFAGQNPIGQQLSLDKQTDITVRGIYRDTPQNTQWHFDFVVSIVQGDGYVGGGDWNCNDIYFAVVRLKLGISRETVNRQMDKAIEQYMPNSETDEYVAHYDALPLPDLHTDNSSVRTRLYIYGFLGFAVFFVAIMNYVLISIATLSRRAKAVGVHKCCGADAGHVFGMFLIETGLLVAGAVLVGLLLIYWSRDVIEDVLSVSLPSLFTVETLWVPLLTVAVLFVVAGVLPGRMFARIPVTQVFRRYIEGKRGWKRGLLFIQFTGVSFVVGLLLVTFLQYGKLMNADLGFRVPGLAVAETWMDQEKAAHLTDDLRRQPMVEAASGAMMDVLTEYWTCGLLDNSGKRIATLNYNPCDKEYVKTMGITLIEGSDLLKPGDVLVNEEVVRLMKWTDGAVGKRLNDFDQAGAIVGVFRNVRNYSFLGEQTPIALIYRERPNHVFNVRLKQPYDDNLHRLNDYMEQAYPQLALEFGSIERQVYDIYGDIRRFRNSVWIASGFILLIVVMGLIGYVGDETQRRSKEIAVRKVNGAETGDILRLLTRGVLWVALPAVALGTVASWFAADAWLEQFPEAISLNPLLLVGTALGVLLVVVCIVVAKAWRIANENPVLSIKSE